MLHFAIYAGVLHEKNERIDAAGFNNCGCTNPACRPKWVQ